MFAFVVHCAGTPLNIEVNFWVFECNAPFHRRPSATPYQRIYSYVDRQKIVFLTLGLLQQENNHLQVPKVRARFTSLAAAFAPASSAWQPHSRGIAPASPAYLQHLRQYHLESWADTMFYSGLAGRRTTTLLCRCSSCRAASFRGSVAISPSFPALPAFRYLKLPPVAVSE